MGGGVAFYISHELAFDLKPELTHMNKDIECLFIELNSHGDKYIILGEIYRPPNSIFIELISVIQYIKASPFLNNIPCFIYGRR